MVTGLSRYTARHPRLTWLGTNDGCAEYLDHSRHFAWLMLPAFDLSGRFGLGKRPAQRPVSSTFDTALVSPLAQMPGAERKPGSRFILSIQARIAG